MSSHHTKEITPSQSISGIYPIWKARGETLAVLLERFRGQYTLGPEAKLTYAGRLDPMAEGLVLVLAGEARFQKDTLLGLPKTYDVSIVLGVASDTHDVLGKITNVAIAYVSEERISTEVATMVTIATLPYPMYSSVPVNGTPLFVHARAGNDVVVPEKKVTIFSAEVLAIEEKLFGAIATKSIDDIGTVAGDFRQAAITHDWQTLNTRYADTVVQVVTIRVRCSSGTYMRSLATWLGDRVGVPALAYSIVRTKLGDFEMTNK
jgi:tRNA pseudouridine55 synthase